MQFNEIITVVLPTFNSSKYLGTAIQSILNQSYSKFELIVVNDGSEDDTDKVIESFHDKRIRYYRIEHSGMGKAINYGLQKANTKWAALMDSDDIAHPERLKDELNYKILNFNDIVFPDSVYFAGNRIKFLNTISGDRSKTEEIIKLHGHICMSGVIFNKDFILENGGFSETLRNSEDYDLWMKLFNKANFVHINIPLMFVRLRENSLSRENYQRTKSIIYSIKQKYNLSYSGITEGWNEFFYGSRVKAREVFLKHIIKPSALTAYIVSLLPEGIFNYIIFNKTIPKIKYSLFKIIFIKKHLQLQDILKKLQSSGKQGRMFD